MIQNILIVKTSALGDVTQAFITLQIIKKIYPETQIDWVVEKASSSLVKAHPLINRSIVIDTKAWKKDLWSSWSDIYEAIQEIRKVNYDVIFDLQANIKSGVITKLARAKEKVGYTSEHCAESFNKWGKTNCYAPSLKASSRSKMIELIAKHAKVSVNANDVFQEPFYLDLSYDQKQQYDNVQDRLDLWDKPGILLAPFSRWENKKLSKAQIIQIVEHLLKNNKITPCLLTGSNQELQEAQSIKQSLSYPIEILEPLPIPVLQNLLYQFLGMIAMDSFPLHLASTTTLPTFSIFGPSAEQFYAPKGPNHDSIQGACPYEEKFVHRCSKLRSCITGLCMKQQSIAELVNRLHKWIDIL